MTMQTVTYGDDLWQIVPKEPTEEMCEAGVKEHRISDGQIYYTYKAVLQVAPKHPIVADDLVKDAERYRYIRTKVKMLPAAAKNDPTTFLVTIFNYLVGIDLTQGNKAKNFDDAVDIAKITSNLKSKE